MVDKVQVENLASLAEQFVELGTSALLNLTTAIVLLISGFLIAKFIANALRARLAKVRGFDQTLTPILAQILRYFIVIITFILVLANFGVETTSIIAVLGAAGLAIGLALQGTLQNVAAGIMLLVIRPFKRGDYIEAGGAEGTVDEIGLFMCRMHTVQGLFVAVPNSMIWSNMITNYSRLPRRRFDMLVGISYDDDIDKARDVLLELLKKDERVHSSPEPLVVVKALGASSVDLEIRAWTDRVEYWDVHFELTKQVKQALDAAGVSIPYPHMQIVTEQSDSEGGQEEKKLVSKEVTKKERRSTRGKKA